MAPTRMATVTCDVFQASDTDAVVDLLAGAFSTGDPPAVAMGLTHAELARFLDLLCRAAAADGLTIVARTSDTNQIVGALLTDDFGTPPALDPSAISGTLLPILAMLDGLDNDYRKERPIVAGRYLHLFMLGVDARFAGRGIAHQLVAECLSNGRRKGYTHAVTEATGVVSQHVFRKLGFTDRLRVAYQDYRYEERPVFASIRGHEATILMDRSLG
jgi:ribosomal protein S18 acetylase RimI-like enzyme